MHSSDHESLPHDVQHSQEPISSDGPGDQSDQSQGTAGQPGKARSLTRPFLYVCTVIFLTVAGMASIWRTNQIFAPEMYHPIGPRKLAAALANGKNFATFDLNINIREMRDAHIASFKKAPDVAILGASHWQEAHVDLLPDVDLYNAHVHRDYYEDMLAVTEMFDRHDKMPKKMIIAIRDRLFTPIAARTDYLWLPGIPYYRAMAKKLAIPAHPIWETLPVERWKELLSLSMLSTNVSRWHKADVKPHATTVDHHDTLDTLRPGGSIFWSREHLAKFTPERSDRLAREFAAENVDSPPKIDPKGLFALDRLFQFLKRRGVEVYLVHPPFNPIYYDRIVNGAYKKGLEKIESLTRGYADKYGFQVFGSFNPHDIGCTADMYIDAEHANPKCQGKILQQFAKLIAPASRPVDTPVAAVSDEPTPKLAAKSEVKPIQPKLALAEPAPVEHLARVAGVSFVERFDANLLHSAVETERADTKLLTRAVLSMLATTVTRGDIAKREQTAARVTKVAMPGGFLPLPVRRPARPNKSVQT
ncbi:MAG: hypothetical protein ACR2PA_01425, partial [Hyphomicrobiaceae bacterium]